jgi:hypothetical protein
MVRADVLVGVLLYWPEAAIHVDVTMHDFSRLVIRYAHWPLAATNGHCANSHSYQRQLLYFM